MFDCLCCSSTWGPLSCLLLLSCVFLQSSPCSTLKRQSFIHLSNIKPPHLLQQWPLSVATSSNRSFFALRSQTSTQHHGAAAGLARQGSKTNFFEPLFAFNGSRLSQLYSLHPLGAAHDFMNYKIKPNFAFVNHKCRGSAYPNCKPVCAADW